jgi:hypothetical protein
MRVGAIVALLTLSVAACVSTPRSGGETVHQHHRRQVPAQGLANAGMFRHINARGHLEGEKPVFPPCRGQLAYT